MSMSPWSTVFVSALTSVAATSAVLATYVELQTSTPGAKQTGHSNISGNSLAARFGANTDPTLARVQINEPGGLQGGQVDNGLRRFRLRTEHSFVRPWCRRLLHN